MIVIEIFVLISKRLKNAAKEDKESIKEEKDATSGPSKSKFNGNDTKEPEASSTTRKPSHENIPSTGRRRSRGLEILGIGEPSTRSKSPRRRGYWVARFVSRHYVPDCGVHLHQALHLPK